MSHGANYENLLLTEVNVIPSLESLFDSYISTLPP